MADDTFVLTIRTLDEFVNFIAFIRSMELDDPKLIAALAKLKQSTAALKAAETKVDKLT